ncbi:MAG: hypothetical protein ABL949_13060 [Fimbriimonadaceae bacterium]
MEFTRDNLAWLADAPAYIDEEQVTAFYDAVVRPDKKTGDMKLMLSSSSSLSATAAAEASASVGVAAWLKSLLPFLDVGVAGSVSGTVEKGGESGHAHEITFSTIDNPHRQLVQLCLYYLSNQPNFIKLETSESLCDRIKGGLAPTNPKELIFLDLPGMAQEPAGRTKFIPMAGEFADGTVKLMFKDIQKMWGAAPSYLTWKSGQTPEEYDSEARTYWKSFGDKFDSGGLMQMVEQAGRRMGRIRWIDYQLMLDDEGRTLHVHCTPNEKANSGIFAHRVIQRGHLYGTRMIGTLCAGPSLNVLAIFDR